MIIFSKWKKELEEAKGKDRQPKLRNALFNTFASSVVLDGFLVLMFVLLRFVLLNYYQLLTPYLISMYINAL